jgi:hypothetical protein
VSPSSRKSLFSIGAVAGGLVIGLGFISVLRGDVSPVTAGMFLGVIGTLCIVTIGFAIRNVRRGEARREAKLQIWMKH